MKRKKIYRRVLIAILLINISAIVGMGYYNLDRKVPDNIKLMVNTDENFNFSLPLQANINSEDIRVLNINNDKLPENKIDFNFSKPFTLRSNKVGNYTIDLKLFGLINFKKVNVDVINNIELIPCGIPIGIYVETDGIMVLGTSSVSSIDGLNYEPALNILKSGDYITAVNHQSIKNKKDLIHHIQNSGGKDLLFSIRRKEEEIEVKIKPVQAPDGEYKIGTWIRDNTQGIGTMTYISPEGGFGALGHGITDIDTSLLMEIKEGSVYTARVMMIVKGEKGTPGEIVGMINQSEQEKLGSIMINSNQGIFGATTQGLDIVENQEPLKIGLKQEVQLGKAYVRCQVEDELQDYEIEIEKIEMNHENLSKGLVIRITDERLLSVTNGIVQGMSGSPIIQNNKIIGAVTHVFIQDSTKGYGIFIENMLNVTE